MSEEIYESDYQDFYDPVKCLGDLGEKWCNFKWNIYDLQLNPLETIQSPVFTTRLLPKTYWYLQVQLLTPGNLRAIKISLLRLRTAESVYSVIDFIFKVTCYEEVMISGKKTCVYNNEASRNERFCYIASFHKLKMGRVTVECKLRPNKIMIGEVRHGKLDATLPVDLRRLLQSGEVCDTIIKVGSQQLMAHYGILCARLPWFLSLEERKEEGKYILEINDLPLWVVKEMLKYAYTGQACLDSKSISCYKDILVKFRNFYCNFFYTCCWEDHPFAETSFNYETDSLEWELDVFDTKEELGRKYIRLLKIYPNELELSLDIIEWDIEKKILTLSFKYCNEKLPRPTIVSCKYSLVNAQSREMIVLGQTETLLSFKIMQPKMKLCSRLEISNAKTFLGAEDLILKTDFKFCYGSNKSSIENLYEGQFDISQCTSCDLLSSDLKRLFYTIPGQKDIEVLSKQGISRAHKAILIARWKDAEKRKVKECSRIVMEEYDDHRELCKFLRYLYSGQTYE